MIRRNLFNRICALTVTAVMMGTTIMGAVPAYAADYAEESLIENIPEEVESPVGEAAESDAAEEVEILEPAAEENVEVIEPTAEEDAEESYVADDERDLEVVDEEVAEEDSAAEEAPEDLPVDESVTEENIEVKAEDEVTEEAVGAVDPSSPCVEELDVSEIQSQHNYSNNMNEADNRWTVGKEGATSIELTFSADTYVEYGDYIYIYDKDGTLINKYTEDALAARSITVDGEEAVIAMSSDSYYTDYGFSLSSAYAVSHKYDQGQVISEATNTSAGIKEYTCSVCGDTKREYFYADGIVKTGQCGPEVYWGLSEDGTLLVSGSGNMDYDSYSDTFWSDYSSDIKQVIIENGVTSIYYNSFKNCNNLTNATIPSDLVKYELFSDCTNLVKVEGISVDGISWTLEKGEGESCQLTISGKGNISDYYSRNNEYYDYETESYIYGRMSPWKLSGFAVTDITIETGVARIGNYAFSDFSNLNNISISDTVTSIGSYAFSGCSNLPSINIPDTLTSVGTSSFRDCSSLLNINIPSGVTSIGDSAFSGCSSMVTARIPADMSSYGLFSGCLKLVEVEGYSENGISWKLKKGEDESCQLTIGGNGEIPDYERNHVYDDENHEWVERINSPWTLKGFNVTNVRIENGVRTIGDCAFSDYENLTNITIPNSVTSIGGGAFNNCSSLISIAIPNSVTSIGGGTFNNCSSLTSIVIPDSVTKIEYEDFRNCSSLINITIPNSIASIGGSAFINCTSLKSITIPDSVASIGSDAFRGCSSLTTINLPNSIEDIEGYMFSGCISLKSITIPSSVDFIWHSAFAGCTNLSEISFSPNITYIGSGAFRDCTSLKSMTLPEKVSNITSGIFTGCSSLETVVLKGSTYTISADAFKDLPALKRVIINSSLRTIESYAFSSCPNLEWIRLPKTLIKVSTGAFRNDTALKTVYYNGTSAEWKKIEIANYNEPLKNANISYTSDYDLKWATISTKSNSYVYTGTAREPKPIINLGEETTYYGTISPKTLVVGTDYDLSYTNNVNVGTATVTARGKGAYTGTISCTYSITPKDISIGTASTKSKTYSYTGTPRHPAMILTVDSKTLTQDKDYTLTYDNNTEVGTATVTAHGIGNYKGEKSCTFRIIRDDKISIDKAEIYTKSESYVYTGTPRNPSPVITLDGKTLVKGTDYDLTYENDLNVGTATVTAYGKGDYAGSVSCTYGITPRDISEGTASTKSKTYAYKGTPRHPAMILVVNSITLVQDVDYTLEYENNIEIGTATVIAHGIGNYTGEISCTFEIVHEGPVSIETAEIHTLSESYVYTGTPRHPNPVITLDGKTLVKGTDYDLTYENDLNVGAATVTANGKGDYTDTVSCTYEITPRDISDGTASTKSKTYAYKGTPRHPAMILVVNSITLVQNVDYILEYENNIEIGTATAIAHGIGNYSGEISCTFEIVHEGPVSIESAEIHTLSESYVYKGTPRHPSPVITLDGTTLVKGTDYDLTYENDLNVGTATVTAHGKGDYTGTVSCTYGITPRDISEGTATTKSKTYAYKGTPRRPAMILVVNSITLVQDVDYALEYENNIEIGTATAIAHGIGNYTGEISCTFEIIHEGPVSIETAEIHTLSESYVYTGTPRHPNPVINLDGKTLVKGTDYDLTYENDLNVGTATVVANGKGDYTDTVSCTYDITPRDISDGTASTKSKTYAYKGTPRHPAMILVVNNITLVQDVDYMLEYEDNIEIGTAKVIAHGIGNYTGEISCTFEIIHEGPMPIETAEIHTLRESYVYTGTPRHPSPIVTLDGKTLVKGTDYDLTYENDLNVGTATVTAHGKGDYTGTVSCTYGITPRDISEGTASTKSKTYAYKGTPRHPAMILVVNNITLVQDVDYTLDYENNIEIGTAKAIAHGIGNYTGEISCTFEIIHDGPVSIETAEIHTKSESYVYTGTPRNPSPIVTLDGKTLVKGTDYDLTYENDLNVGTATVIAHGKGAYTGTVSCTYGITPRDISEGTASTKSKSYAFNGKPRHPAMILVVNNRTLVKDVDYTLTYENDTEVGTATVTAHGIGNYVGEKSCNYGIVIVKPTTIQYAKITTKSPSYVYTGTPRDPSPIITLGGKTLVKGTDYDLSYKNDVNVGTATVTATGKGDYKGTVSCTYGITPRDISDGTASTKSWAYLYKGTPRHPNMILVVNNKTLVKDKDFTLSYENDIEPGTATVTANGIGNYQGQKSCTFEILAEAIDISECSIAGNSLSYGYSGKAYTPNVTVKLDGTTLTKDTDYTIAYKNNVNPGTASITVTGKGIYAGTRTKTFEIVDCVSSLVSGKTYQLIPKNNSKTAVSSFGGKMVKNTKVYITDRSNSEAMKFKAIQNADGTWKFINAKCEMELAVKSNSSAVGNYLVLYDQTTKPAQNWKLTRKSDNSFGIINAVSGLYVAMSDESAVKGTTLSMEENSGRGLQRFYIAETTAVSAPFDGTRAVKASKNKNYAVSIASASKEDGANVSLAAYSSSNDKKFNIIYSGGGYYRLVNVNSKLVLTVEGNTKTNGANVIQSEWAGESGQRWKFTKNADGTVTLTNALGTVLHLNGNKTANGTNIIAKTASTTGAQKWYLE